MKAAPGLAVVAAVGAAGFLVSGRILAGLGDVGERLLPLAAVLAALVPACGRRTASIAAGVVAAAALIPPYAANAWTPVQGLAGALAAALFVGAATAGGARMPRPMALAIGVSGAFLLYAAGNAVLAALLAAAALAATLAGAGGAFAGFAAAVLVVGYLYGGLGSVASATLGSAVLLPGIIFWGDRKHAGTLARPVGRLRALLFRRRRVQPVPRRA